MLCRKEFVVASLPYAPSVLSARHVAHDLIAHAAARRVNLRKAKFTPPCRGKYENNTTTVCRRVNVTLVVSSLDVEDTPLQPGPAEGSRSKPANGRVINGTGVGLAVEGAVFLHVSDDGADLEPAGSAICKRLNGTESHNIDLLNARTVRAHHGRVLLVRNRHKRLFLVDNHVELDQRLLLPATGGAPQRVQHYRLNGFAVFTQTNSSRKEAALIQELLNKGAANVRRGGRAVFERLKRSGRLQRGAKGAQACGLLLEHIRTKIVGHKLRHTQRESRKSLVSAKRATTTNCGGKYNRIAYALVPNSRRELGKPAAQVERQILMHKCSLGVGRTILPNRSTRTVCRKALCAFTCFRVGAEAETRGRGEGTNPRLEKAAHSECARPGAWGRANHRTWGQGNRG